MVKFAIFTVISIKMHSILVNCVGSVVLKNHMHAAIHYVITEVIVVFDESSNFNEALSNFRRLERISCLGSACKMRTFLEFPLHQIRHRQIRQYDNVVETTKRRRRRIRQNDVVARYDKTMSPSNTTIRRRCGNIGVPICKKVGNFFLNLKVCY